MTQLKINKMNQSEFQNNSKNCKERNVIKK